MTLTHAVSFIQGHDCIQFECINDSPHCHPESMQSHGKGGLNIHFVCSGPDGAICFNISTGWMPQYAQPNKVGDRHVEDWTGGCAHLYPSSGCITYHSKVPQYAGQQPRHHACSYCGGGTCYSDSGSLVADEALYALVNGGDAGLWAYLDGYYAHTFQDAPVPIACEYKKPVRVSAESTI